MTNLLCEASQKSKRHDLIGAVDVLTDMSAKLGFDRSSRFEIPQIQDTLI
jgi:hypothetical protein